MAAEFIYGGQISGGVIATAIGVISASTLVSIPRSNGQEVVIINCKG